MNIMTWGLDAAERGWLPDWLLRAGMRRLCAMRLRQAVSQLGADGAGTLERFLEESRGQPIAPQPDQANAQHYELPPQFFELLLGPRQKYSCCLWESATTKLEEAEATALAQTCAHADLRDGQDILELGCGWGALSLWMAEQYPNCRITAMSNSATQRKHIEAMARRRGLDRLRVITADVNFYEPDKQFDRVVSVEMFEHTRNLPWLLARIATWLHPEGRLFVHWFCHRQFAYAFETDGDANWMGRHFFTGGMMPALGLLERCRDDLHVERSWQWSGLHYRRTAEAWLANLDSRLPEAKEMLRPVYGPDSARWVQRWRMFLLAVAECFGFRGGEEWLVGHYLLASHAAANGRDFSARLAAPSSETPTWQTA